MAASLAVAALGLGGGVIAVAARHGTHAAGEAGGRARTADARLAEELARELGERRHVLPTQTVAAATESLRLLSAAVAETERRLAADPNNGHLEAMLTRARLQQVEFVRSTVALAADL